MSDICRTVDISWSCDTDLKYFAFQDKQRLPIIHVHGCMNVLTPLKWC